MSRIFPTIVSILRQKNYLLFQRPYELNIVGIRSRHTRPNRFDDEFHVFYRKPEGNAWNYHVFTVTTDPGTYYLHSPISKEMGTAILAPGQYVNCYKLGMHKGLYPAVVQKAPVTVIRDYDRDAYLDFKSPRRETGNFGINIHKHYVTGTAKTVGQSSAGCTVFENDDKHDDVFIPLVRKHIALYGNELTYTLLDYRARRRELLKRAALLTGVGIAGIAAYMRLTDSELEDYLRKKYREYA